MDAAYDFDIVDGRVTDRLIKEFRLRELHVENYVFRESDVHRLLEFSNLMVLICRTPSMRAKLELKQKYNRLYEKREGPWEELSDQEKYPIDEVVRFKRRYARRYDLEDSGPPSLILQLPPQLGRLRPPREDAGPPGPVLVHTEESLPEIRDPSFMNIWNEFFPDHQYPNIIVTEYD